MHKKRFAFTAAAVFLAILAAAAFVPPVRAQVVEFFNAVFRFGTDDYTILIGTYPGTTFQSYQPSHVPQSLDVLPEVIVQDTRVEMIYQNGELFLVVNQTPAGGELPAGGETVLINGRQGHLQTGLAGTYAQDLDLGALQGSGMISVDAVTQNGNEDVFTGTLDALTPAAPVPGTEIQPITIIYLNANRLVWIIDGTCIELLSNLPPEELLRIAEGMIPAQ